MAESYDHLQGDVNDVSTHDEYKLTTDASSAAAYRTRESVRPTGGRQEGGATYAPIALALTPLVLGAMAHDTYKRFTK